MFQPFFTIAITTYNRHDLLKEALTSILAQDFNDFEVLVGNDYQGDVLTRELLGITDPRIRFINHPHNLREVGNMNALLAAASGRYFTWLFDDDLYEPGFLQVAHDVLLQTEMPPALFPSYKVVTGPEFLISQRIPLGDVQIMTGRQYLHKYFSGRLKIISTCGLFDTVTLREKVGGVEELCSSAIGLYSEYLFLVRCALLGRIAYVDAPFVIFRAHSGSWSECNVDLNKYLEAGQQLVRRCADVLHHPDLSADLEFDLRGICRLHMTPFAILCARVEIAKRNYVIRAVCRAAARVMEEVTTIHKVYVAAAGVDSYWARAAFLYMKIKSIYIVLHTFVTKPWRR